MKTRLDLSVRDASTVRSDPLAPAHMHRNTTAPTRQAESRPMGSGPLRSPSPPMRYTTTTWCLYFAQRPVNAPNGRSENLSDL